MPEPPFRTGGDIRPISLDVKGFDDEDLHQTVKVGGGFQHRVGGGAGVAELHLLHCADREAGGIIPAQAGGDHQIAAQQLTVRGQIVQPQAVLPHQGEVAHRQPQVLGAEHLGAQGGVRVHDGEDRAPVESHFADHTHQGIRLVDDAVVHFDTVIRADVQCQGGGPVGDRALRDGGRLQLQVIVLGPQVQQIPQAGVFLIVGLSQAVLGLEDGVFPPQGGVLLLQGGDVLIVVLLVCDPACYSGVGRPEGGRR